jgi:hypothetical protein
MDAYLPGGVLLPGRSGAGRTTNDGYVPRRTVTYALPYQRVRRIA